MAKKIKYMDDGSVQQKFGTGWVQGRDLKPNQIADYVASLAEQLKNQAEYVDALHREVDKLKKKLSSN